MPGRDEANNLPRLALFNMMTENENAGPRAGVSYTLLPLLSAIVVVMSVMLTMPFVLTAFSADVLTVNPMVPEA